MEFRTLRAFVEVVRQGGFSQAAKAIYATQSTVSKAVKQLEDEIGATLLDRVGHRSTLTDAGQVVYRRALRLLTERDDLVTEIEEIRGLKRGTLRLGLPRIGSSTLFAPLFARFRRAYPGIEVRLVEEGSDQLQEMLMAGEVDLAGILLPAPADLDWRGVRREPLVALLPVGHTLLGRDHVSLDELQALPFILFEQGFALNRIILEICSRHGFSPTIAARSGQIDFIIALVESGVGVAFLPRLIAEEQKRPGISTVEISDPETEWHMAMMWRRGAYLSHAARAWLNIVGGSDGA